MLTTDVTSCPTAGGEVPASHVHTGQSHPDNSVDTPAFRLELLPPGTCMPSSAVTSCPCVLPTGKTQRDVQSGLCCKA